MSKYKNCLYPDKVNDLIDNDGNIKIPAGPVEWYTKILDQEDDNLILECTPEFYQTIKDTIPSTIVAHVIMEEHGEEYDNIMTFVHVTVNGGMYLYASLMNMVEDDMNILLMFTEEGQALVEVSEGGGGKEHEDKWSQPLFSNGPQELQGSTYNMHKRADDIENYDIRIVNNSGSDFAWSSAIPYDTNIYFQDSFCLATNLVCKDDTGESTVYTVVPMVFDRPNGYARISPAENITLKNGTRSYINFTICNEK